MKGDASGLQTGSVPCIHAQPKRPATPSATAPMRPRTKGSREFLCSSTPQLADVGSPALARSSRDCAGRRPPVAGHVSGLRIGAGLTDDRERRASGLRRLPAVRDRPGPASVLAPEQPERAALEQDIGDAVVRHRRGAAEVDLRLDHFGADPAPSAVARQEEQPAALPEDPSPSGHEGDSLRIAVAAEAPGERLVPPDRARDGGPDLPAVARREHGLLLLAGPGLADAEEPAAPRAQEAAFPIPDATEEGSERPSGTGGVDRDACGAEEEPQPVRPVAANAPRRESAAS